MTAPRSEGIAESARFHGRVSCTLAVARISVFSGATNGANSCGTWLRAWATSIFFTPALNSSTIGRSVKSTAAASRALKRSRVRAKSFRRKASGRRLSHSMLPLAPKATPSKLNSSSIGLATLLSTFSE